MEIVHRRHVKMMAANWIGWKVGPQSVRNGPTKLVIIFTITIKTSICIKLSFIFHQNESKSRESISQRRKKAFKQNERCKAFLKNEWRKSKVKSLSATIKLPSRNSFANWRIANPTILLAIQLKCILNSFYNNFAFFIQTNTRQTSDKQRKQTQRQKEMNWINQLYAIF